MATNEHIIKAPGMMKNLAVGGHLTTADQVLDDAMGKEQSQINAETATAITNEVSRAEAAEELLRQAYEALTQSTPVPVTELPESGEEGVIYRLAGETSYSDYMWDGTQFVEMAEYDNAIDDELIADSDNIAKSGAAAKANIKYEARVIAGDADSTNIVLNISLKSDDRYYLTVLSNGNIMDDGKISIYYILEDGTEVYNSDVGSNNVITMPFEGEIVCSVNNVRGIRLNRINSAAIVGNGTITVYAIKSEFFKLIEENQEKARDGILDEVGYFKFKGNTVSGEAFRISAYTNNLTEPFMLSIDRCDDVLFGSDAENGVNLHFILSDNSELSAGGYIEGQASDIVYLGRTYKVNIPSGKDIIGISLSRVYTRVIGNGTVSATINLTSGIFYTKSTIDGMFGMYKTISNTEDTVVNTVYYNEVDFGTILKTGKVVVTVTGDDGIVADNKLNIGVIDENGSLVDFVGAFAYPFTYNIDLSDNPCSAVYIRRQDPTKVTGVGSITVSADVNVPTVANIQSSFDKTVYVDVNGDDTNDGSSANPVATINQALKLGNVVIVNGGVYKEQTINFGLCQKNNVNIMAKDAEKVCLLSNIIASSATKEEGYTKVYSCQIDTDLTNRNWLFQYGEEDASTLIDSSYRTYIHSRKKYRCDCTRLVRVGSIAAVDSWAGYAWYVDGSTLYFSSPSVVSTDKPIFVGGGSLMTGLADKHIKMNGIRSYGKTINANSINNAEFCNCAAIGCTGGAGWTLNLSQNAVLKMCEAAFCDNSVTTTTGDGFNVHSSSAIGVDTDMDSVFSTFTLIDCWSHDNFNDGYSDHEGCNGHIQNGVFEFNCCGADGMGSNTNGVGYAGHGGGLCPAHGAQDVIEGAICQRNYDDGVRYASDNDMTPMGCEVGTFTAISVLSRNNTHYGFNVNKANQIADVINCNSVSNGTANYHSENGAVMRLINSN